MSKTKVAHKISKLTPVKSKIKPYLLVALSILGGALLVGSYYYSNMKRVSINEIQSVRPPGILPQPSPNQLDCQKVTTFSLSGSCEKNSYQTTSFTCGSTRTLQTQGGQGSCKSVSVWYENALSACAASCPNATPTPTSTPTPKPSLTPPPKPSVLPYPSATSIPRPKSRR